MHVGRTCDQVITLSGICHTELLIPEYKDNKGERIYFNAVPVESWKQPENLLKGLG